MSANYRLLLRNLRLMEPQKRLASIGEQAIIAQAAIAAMYKAKREHSAALRALGAYGLDYTGNPHEDDPELAKLYATRKDAAATARRERARLRAAINHHLKPSGKPTKL